MIESEANDYLGYCQANEVCGLFEQEFFGFNGQGINLNQCYLEEGSRNIEMSQALAELASGTRFALYDLHLTKEDKELISQIEITAFNDISITNSIFAIGELKQEVRNALAMMRGVKILEMSKVAHLITRLASLMMGELGGESFELRFRTREGYESTEDCMYWHLDKSQKEIVGDVDDGKEKRLIIVLKGAGTVYQAINEKQREEFIRVATEAPYYYGHDLEGCRADDQITKLLSANEIIRVQEGYGAIHIGGSKGAMHSAPKESVSRLILLLTPKNN